MKEERFAFSRGTRDDNVFASLADKIPQVSSDVNVILHHVL